LDFFINHAMLLLPIQGILLCAHKVARLRISSNQGITMGRSLPVDFHLPVE